MTDLAAFTLDDARLLAYDKHIVENSQTDAQDRDYFFAHLEPVALALMPYSTHAEMAGYLHDIVEDTDTTLADLLDAGVPPTVVDAVDAVTRRPREAYADLIGRACAHPLGALVKLADNTLNLSGNAALAAIDPDKAASLHKRYTAARVRLIAATGLTAAQVAQMEATLAAAIARYEAATDA
jgi:(p)ppGpp synthase/HD superfamily hydrolase